MQPQGSERMLERMTIPVQRYSAAWVQFPRFEKSGSSETAQKIACSHRWLSPAMARVVQNPHTGLLAGRLDLKLTNHWIGVYHSAREYQTRGERFHTPKEFAQPLIAADGRELYRSRLFLHDFMWDEQAIPGRRWEVVLERGRTDEPAFEELLAVMGDPNRPAEGQYVVMKNEQGEWFGPDPSGSANEPLARKREFFLETLGCLALNGASAAEILPAD